MRGQSGAPEIFSKIISGDGKTYKLSTDKRTPFDSSKPEKNPVNISVGLFERSPPWYTGDVGEALLKTRLRFQFPDSNEVFGGQPIIAQRYPNHLDSSEKGMPCWDVTKLIALTKNHIGKMPDVNVPNGFMFTGKAWDLTGYDMSKISEGKNYLTLSDWQIRVGRDLFDINEDGLVDEKDVSVVEENIGYEGNNRGDIASIVDDPANPQRKILVEGIPDKKVTEEADLVAIKAELARRRGK